MQKMEDNLKKIIKTTCDGDKGGGEHDGLGSIGGVADEQGVTVNVMVIREEVNMMGLVVLGVWLRNRGSLSM